ncbi:hypothetical protein [Streptomyces sp. NPDC006691]|uniref:hypothetical protein n=1 Tax=Streptomyces sp. NPDC006691 TaxID=3364757 RepID=UPI00369D75A3
MYGNRDDQPAAVTAPELHLSYQLTVQDFKEALRARMKGSASARRQRAVALVCGVVALALLSLVVATGGGLPVPELVSLATFAFLMFGLPQLQARQFHKLSERNGETRSTVSAAGVTVAHRQAATTLTWLAKTRYVETSHLFVLLGPDKNASSVTILPKRGATDVDALRAALDRYTTRL